MIHINNLLTSATSWSSIIELIENAITASGAEAMSYLPYYDSGKIVLDNRVIDRYNTIIFRTNEIQLHVDPDIERTRRIVSAMIANDVVSDDTYLKGGSLMADKCNSLDEVVDHIINLFTDKVYGDAHQLRQNLESNLIELADKVTASGISNDPYEDVRPVLRFEEQRTDFVVTLAISPFDYRMVLGLRAVERYVYDNPLTRFYSEYYTQDADEGYARFNDTHHAFQFLEHKGFEYNPDAKKNANSFVSIFGQYDMEEDVAALLRNSGTAQRHFLTELIAYLNVFCGPDCFGRSWIDPKTDTLDVELDDKDEGIQCFNVSRHFFTPYADIQIIAYLYDMYGAGASPFPMVAARVVPFAGDVPNKKAAYLHPFIYDMK